MADLTASAILDLQGLRAASWFVQNLAQDELLEPTASNDHRPLGLRSPGLRHRPVVPAPGAQTKGPSAFLGPTSEVYDAAGRLHSPSGATGSSWVLA